MSSDDSTPLEQIADGEKWELLFRVWNLSQIPPRLSGPLPVPTRGAA